jgi:hypothetical protein
MIFVGQPLDPRGGGSNPIGPPRPPRPSRCFRLRMNLGKPLIPPNRPYCWPLNYLKYVNDFDPNAHV